MERRKDGIGIEYGRRSPLPDLNILNGSRREHGVCAIMQC